MSTHNYAHNLKVENNIPPDLPDQVTAPETGNMSWY